MLSAKERATLETMETSRIAEKLGGEWRVKRKADASLRSLREGRSRRDDNARRRLGPEHHLEEILSVRVARRVAQDHTVSWDGNRWGVVREEVCAGPRGAEVEIERRLDGSHWMRYRGRYLHLRSCPEAFCA